MIQFFFLFFPTTHSMLNSVLLNNHKFVCVLDGFFFFAFVVLKYCSLMQYKKLFNINCIYYTWFLS